MNKDIKEFRDSIFSLNTRRFGKVAEIMIKKLYNFEDSNDDSYDLYSIIEGKIEVKFSRVLLECTKKITENNIISTILESSQENRMITFKDIKTKSFDSNIQQVKTSCFDVLYYGLFFSDKILVFKIDSNTIKTDLDILYSDYQHRNNEGEGQFHINNSTILNHLKKYLINTITYEDLYNLFK